MSKFDNKYFWVRFRNGKWVIAERRFYYRYFICGVDHVLTESLEDYGQKKDSTDIVEIGEEVICPYGKIIHT